MRITILIALLSGFSSLFAANTPGFVKNLQQKNIVLDLSQWKNQSVNITISNDLDEKIFSEICPNKKFRKYNLNNLPSGNYKVTIEDNQKIAIQEFIIAKNSISINSDTREIFKPQFVIKENEWSLQALAQDNKSKIYISDENGDIIYEESIAKPSLTRRYDVSKLPSGRYEINYSIDGRTFSQNVIR